MALHKVVLDTRNKQRHNSSQEIKTRVENSMVLKPVAHESRCYVISQTNAAKLKTALVPRPTFARLMFRIMLVRTNSQQLNAYLRYMARRPVHANTQLVDR